MIGLYLICGFIVFLIGIFIGVGIPAPDKKPRAKVGSKIKITSNRIFIENKCLEGETFYITEVMQFKDSESIYVVDAHEHKILLKRDQFIIYK